VRLSTKSRYGLRALFDMAYNAGAEPIQIKDIARRQDISPRYLEQIFQAFKKAGILQSKKGPQGGYSLARQPERITVRDVIEAAEGDTLLVSCTSPAAASKRKKICPLSGRCVTQTVWQEATALLDEYFQSVTLQTLCERAATMGLKREADQNLMFYI
jgi:Rrf2 family protein